MRPLVEAGYVYIAQPPLYSTEVGKEKIYLKDDAAKAAFLAERPNHKKEFQRLKGLGEMDWDELKRDHHGPDTRTLLQVTVEEAALADEIMSVLMGDDVELRKQFIQHQRQRRALPGHSDDDFETTESRPRIPGPTTATTTSPRPIHRADRDPGRDGALVPRLRHVGHHVPRPCPTCATASSRCTAGSSGTWRSRASGPTGPS